MSTERSFLAALRALPNDPAARGLLDDAAVLEIGGVRLVLTKDMLVEGVHYLADDPPADVAWKLLAVNLSDLAAKGARPRAALLGYMLGEEAWDLAFLAGMQTALASFAVPLLGGDTVSGPAGSARVLSLTAIGLADGPVPSRSGAEAGDLLWVSGSIGDAGAGLATLRGELAGSEPLVRRYRAPRPRLEAGQALAPLVSAMMDVSDGLLIDADRLGHASGVGTTLELEAIPLSEAFLVACGSDRDARLRAATAGDDYELLFTAAPGRASQLLALAETLGLPLTRIGRIEAGAGLQVTEHGAAVALPDRLGYEHGTG
jgi:thiamine-monophosphate kinase